MFQQFYDSVKDPSWPEISDYKEFLSLPEPIKNECVEMHGLVHRLKQIHDHNYWAGLVWKYFDWKGLHFFPVPKCASTYYEKIYQQLGWTKIKGIDRSFQLEGAARVGLMMDPVERYLKGLAEYFYIMGLEQHPNIDKMIDRTLTPDLHSLPVSLIFRNYFQKINWIPMDLLSDNDIKVSLMSFFKLHGHDINLPMDDQREYISNTAKKNLYEKIKQSFYNNPEKIESVYNLLADDIKFYHELVNKFSPTWQHI